MSAKAECPHCNKPLTAIYERESTTAQGTVRAYCAKCLRQGNSAVDFNNAVKSWYVKHRVK